MDVVEIEKPEPGPGDVILRVRGTGICGSDLLMNLDKTEPDRFPAGHEVAGEVIDVGDGVDASLVGERVAVDTLGAGLACMDCWYCRMGQFQTCDSKRPSEGGGFAQYMKRRAFGCYRLPDSLTWEEGGLVEPLAVSVHGVRRGQMSGGETVAVLGAGNIGLSAVAAARALGAGTVLASARHPQQAAMARSLGADEALPSEGRAFQDAVEEATEGRGADLTIETVGGEASGDPGAGGRRDQKAGEGRGAGGIPQAHRARLDAAAAEGAVDRLRQLLQRAGGTSRLRAGDRADGVGQGAGGADGDAPVPLGAHPGRVRHGLR